MLPSLRHDLSVIEELFEEHDIDTSFIISVRHFVFDAPKTSVLLSQSSIDEFDSLAEGKKTGVYDAGDSYIYDVIVDDVEFSIMKEKSTATTVDKERNDT